MNIEFKPGDIILTGADDIVGKTIRWFTRHRKEDRGFKSHAGIGTNNISYLEALLRVRLNKYNDLFNRNTNIEVWRNITLTDEQLSIIKNKSWEYFNRLYGPQKIILQAFDGILGKIFAKEVYLFRKLGFIDRYPICSWVVSYSYDKINYRFDVHPKYAAPDCIHDHLVKNDDWKIVYTNREEYYNEYKRI